MNRTVVVIAALALAGCAASSSKPTGEIVASDRDRIIKVAKKELERRNATLPRTYDVTVEIAEAGNEIEPSREVYQVSFSFVYRGKKEVVYTVIINKLTGKVEVFSDSRSAIPSDV